MKSMKKSIVLALVPFALVACGGGGGGDSAATDPQEEAKAKARAEIERQILENTRKRTEEMRYTGGYFENQNGVFLTSSTILGQGSNLSAIKVNGTTYNLPDVADADSKSGNILIYGSTNGHGTHVTSPDGLYSYKSFQMSDNTYQYSRIGFLSSGEGQGVFYVGKFTPSADMPLSGEASYVGDALVAYRNAQQFSHVERGSVSANVDFGSKNVSVSLKAPSYSGQARAVVSGSSISNVEPSSSYKGVYGSFFGDNAEEIAGRFYDFNESLDAVFNAKRQ